MFAPRQSAHAAIDAIFHHHFSLTGHYIDIPQLAILIFSSDFFRFRLIYLQSARRFDKPASPALRIDIDIFRQRDRHADACQFD